MDTILPMDNGGGRSRGDMSARRRELQNLQFQVVLQLFGLF